MATLVIAGLALSGCSNGGSSTGGTQTDSGGKITVWVDPPRVPAADAFKKAHPEIPINIVQIDGTVGGKTVQQQFAQFDAAKKGWPDAIFFPFNDDIAWATSAKSNYAADVGKLMPDVVSGYDPAVLSMCDIGGATRCLRNDAAPDVFWYNAKFFKDNGYTLPTTWEEYATLGAKIAKEHPGMISGFTGDAYAPDRYLWAADCPTNDTVSGTKVLINLDDPKCQRAKDLLTTLYDGKGLAPAPVRRVLVSRRFHRLNGRAAALRRWLGVRAPDERRRCLPNDGGRRGRLRVAAARGHRAAVRSSLTPPALTMRPGTNRQPPSTTKEFNDTGTIGRDWNRDSGHPARRK